jgi:hypothetical protein
VALSIDLYLSLDSIYKEYGRKHGKGISPKAYITKYEASLSLYLIKHYAMKKYGEVDI